ncbi:U3 small nucleolar ribonucleoprotein protein MPP10 [Orussus abietinus]|uniref:U3 small nucleolar ribonucleoprotein protein MPP10 n=1 Tax=Orussus abietinus TaxID=222816 RepID=UPI000625F1E6|nr:U3 small nucleolar ribonucleoprotein protein MPP10 [Orussus abietinus]
MATINILENVISTVDDRTQKPERFLSLQEDVADEFQKCVKILYDFTKEESEKENSALPTLITNGFDEEQIWQQIELQNGAEWSRLLKNVSIALASTGLLTLPISVKKNETISDNNESEDCAVSDVPENESEVHDTIAEEKVETTRVNKKRKQKSSIVDDKFFKLQELDEYLKKEDRKELHTKAESTDESDDESVDYFNDFSEEEQKEAEDARLVKYASFFDSPERDVANVENNIENSINEDDDKMQLGSDISEDDAFSEKNTEVGTTQTKRVKFSLTNASDDSDSAEENKNENEENTNLVSKSSLEARQDRLKKKIKELEEEALTEKPWQLKGEVNAVSRPYNSLLQEYVEFDVATRPPPLITEQTTVRLEDIIKQRIKDKAWDDVEKKFKPIETPLEYKKKLVMDQEKSKRSLAQIYEEEYLKQKQALDPEHEEKEEEEPKAHTEIREKMKTLFAQLDALSNYHFTPKMAKPDVKIVSNIPAINMEEVAPVATSDMTLLAPEEIKDKPRGDIIGKSERTDADKKRERRQKKLKQRKHYKAKEERKETDDIKPSLKNKLKKNKLNSAKAKLSKARNVLKMNESTQKVSKSSTAFFNQLQDQVRSQIKSKAPKVTKNDQNTLSAVKLKL